MDRTSGFSRKWLSQIGQQSSTAWPRTQRGVGARDPFHRPIELACEHLPHQIEEDGIDDSRFWDYGLNRIPEGKPDLSFGELPAAPRSPRVAPGSRVPILSGPMRGLTGTLIREITEAGEAEVTLGIPVTVPIEAVAAA